MNKDIPVIALQRLPVYLNYLKSMPADRMYVSSGLIAEALEMGEVLVRKDLAYTSATGKPRVGYIKSELIAALEDFLCCNGSRNAVLAGAGGLGLLIQTGCSTYNNYGINVVAAFDNNPEKIGGSVVGKPVYDIEDAQEKIANLNAELAVICVPAQFAQSVADKLVASGIKAILNFAPVMIKAPQNVVVRHIDVAANLAVLSSMI